MNALKKLWYWLKIMVWESNKDKVADEICKQVDSLEIKKEDIEKVNEEYHIGLDKKAVDAIADNIKNIIKVVIKRQI